VVTENFSPGTMDKLGFGYETLRKLNPALVYASTSGFGQTGPYRERGAVDAIVQGMGGAMSMTGHAGGPPARAGYSIGDMAGGMYTAIGVLSALVERSTSGAGQHVDVAMLDCQVALMENAIVRHCATGVVPGPVGYRHPLATPHGAVPASDGWLVLANVKDHDWDEFLVRIGLDDLVGDERFSTNANRTPNYAELEPLLFAAFRKRTVAQWLDALSDISLIGPLNTVDKVVADPQVQARDMVVELPTWTGGALRVSNTPVKLSRTPGGASRGASKPGEHTTDLLARAGLDDAAIADLVARGVARTGPAE
jgi:CoA:oxalate CoA-transferase